MTKKNGVYVRQALGQKKLAPVDMRKETYQFVIDGYLIDEVLKQIPDTIKILGAGVRCVQMTANRRLIIPNKLKALGASYLRVREAALEMNFVFDQTTKATIVKSVKEGCKIQGLDYSRAFFGYLLLSNGQANGKFNHVTKELRPDELDQRKKLRVLGLVSGQGPIQSLIADLGAKKYRCEVKEELTRLLMCSKA